MTAGALVAGGAVCAALATPQTLQVQRDAASSATENLSIEAPGWVVAGAPFRVKVQSEGLAPGRSLPIELRVLHDGAVVGDVLHASLDGDNPAVFDKVTATVTGLNTLEVRRDDRTAALEVRAFPGLLTVLPPLLAIAMAIAFRQVIVALVAGIWVGATLVVGFNPFIGALRVIDRYLLNALTDPDHASIVIFTMLLGGLVAIVSRSGGMQGIVNVARRWAEGRRSTQVVTWCLGLFIFFDDYTNSLIVGNTMRPVTDRQRISREKLAYLVDSTSAPIASIALISTWIGFEVGLIGSALQDIGSDLDPYQVFMASIPYRFYPILALVFALAVAVSRRDFGPMLAAENRALRGQVLAPGAVAMAEFESDRLAAKKDKPHRWINAVAPIAAIIGVTLVGLWVTGRASLLGDGKAQGLASTWELLTASHLVQNVGVIFSAGNSYRALMWGAGLGCLIGGTLAISQKILSIRETLDTWIVGMKSMLLAIIILLLAWAIGDVCADLHTAGYLVGLASQAMPWALLPAIVFVISGAVAFATGTSWATMAILIPITVPLAREVALLNNFPAGDAHVLLLGAISSVLAGATWGDHCSPISDTTILSSMASGSDHIDHVRTQMPYALVVGAVAVLLCDIPSALGLSPWLALLVAGAVLVGILRLLGRQAGGTTPPAAARADAD